MLSTSIFLALMFGIWRLTDGGFHRHPVSNVLGWLLVAVVCLGTIDNHYVSLVIAAIMGRQITQGYEDWNDWQLMAMRAWPSALVPPLLAAAAVGGWYQVDYHIVWLVPVLVLIGNVAQPWIRAQFKGHASNRTAEAFEGLTFGASLSLL